MKHFLIVLSLFAIPVSANAQDHRHGAAPRTADLSDVRSLSGADVAELRRGGGWGLARPAELNGVPGPAHLLELKDEIPLSEAQAARAAELVETMRHHAIQLGEELIALEVELEQGFRGGSMTPVRLKNLLDEIAVTRARLRFVHLSAHLETVKFLTKQQIRRYAVLRGYTDPTDEAVGMN
ncbi:hypothetical protein [Pacificispira sp.]|uniref:hypothetical protein n=1 Tax=Pacificispira sp. TaxID=2888761 RepID=UPI003BAD565D